MPMTPSSVGVLVSVVVICRWVFISVAVDEEMFGGLASVVVICKYTGLYFGHMCRCNRNYFLTLNVAVTCS